MPQHAPHAPRSHRFHTRLAPAPRSGSLEDLLADRRTPLPWLERRLPLAIGVGRGLAYLHAQVPPLVHRDLKPANVLLSADLSPKIGDLGSALELGDGATDEVGAEGTPLFQAPEAARRRWRRGYGWRPCRL